MNLNINKSKTEEYTISRKGEENWKKCKYLGSLLDTDEDIKGRKILALQTLNKFNKIFKQKKLSKKIKIKIFGTFVDSIFLYNSELWTPTKKKNNEIDSFQRRLLRNTLRIRWPKKLSNKPKLTWIKQINEDPKETKVNINRKHMEICRK